MDVSGVIPACVTPFDGDGGVDLAVLGRLIEWQIGAGVRGIFVVGTAGEFWALSVEEKEAIWRAAVETVAGRVAVFAGTCDSSTAATVHLARRAQAAGVDGVTVLTPLTVKLSQDELAAHFRAVAEAVEVGVLLYNNPKLTGMTIAPETAAGLAAACPNIRGVKDSSGEVSSVRAFVEATPPGFAVLNGYDAQVLPALEAGAAGAVSGSANALPHLCVRIHDAFSRGDRSVAAEAQDRYTRFRQMWRLGTPPAVIKAGADLAGIPVGPPRPPVKPLGPGARARLAEVMRTIGLDLPSN